MKTDIEYLQSVSKYDTDGTITCDTEICGQCYHILLMAQVAQQMLAQDDTNHGATKRHWDEVTRRWQKSKFYKLYQEEIKKGRNPEDAFQERKWKM